MQLRRNRTTLEVPTPTASDDDLLVDLDGDGNGGDPLLSVGGDDENGEGKPPKRPRPRLKKLRVLLVLFGLSILAFVSWVFGIMAAVAQDLPQLEDRAQFAHAKNSVILDNHNHRLAIVTNNAGRILIPSKAIAPVMKEATVAIEDQRFYEHRGVDFVGIGRAVFQDILSQGASQGASTITEQFVKNALRAQGSRTVFQKLREAALAYQLERHWDKDKILTEYLNEIYFGEGAYGIEAAAKTYFGWNHPNCGTAGHRCASELLPWEAAMLAGIISSPFGYDPKTNPKDARARRNVVLANMRDQGYITPGEYERYSRVPLPNEHQIRPPHQSSAAPYFTSWLRQQLVDLYGAGTAFSGGLKVKSTLDLELENKVQGVVDDHVAGLGPSAAVAVVDNNTGGILALVGGTDYKSQPFNIATEGARQPGSSFKPFTLVTALEQGISPSSVWTSAPQALPYKVEVPPDETKTGVKKDAGSGKGNGKGKTGKGKKGKRTSSDKPKIINDLFRVENYANEYAGSRTLQDATTFSDNSVYSQVGMQVGPANVAATAQKIGITSPLNTPGGLKYSVNDGPFTPYNPALILGGLSTGVNPLEMAHAYDTLAEDGKRTSGTMAAQNGGPVGILKVTDSGGHLVEPDNGASGLNEIKQQQVVPATVAQTTKSILQTVVSSGTGVHAQTGGYVWGKTGTTTDNGDAWFVGATNDITVAIWVGYADSNKPMSTLYNGGPVDGGTIPADIFADIISNWETIKAAERAHRRAGATHTGGSSSVPTYVAPSTTAPAPAPAAPAPSADGGGATQAAPAPTPAPTPAPAPGGTGGGAASGGGIGAG